MDEIREAYVRLQVALEDYFASLLASSRTTDGDWEKAVQLADLLFILEDEFKQ